MSEPILKNRIALISGASRGLGRAIAVALAQAGASIALVARDVEQLEITAAEVRAAGGKAGVYRADLTDEAQVSALEKQIREEMGPVQILVNNGPNTTLSAICRTSSQGSTATSLSLNNISNNNGNLVQQ